MTIDDLALATGTTTRRIRSLQTIGLVPHPDLRGRTGQYRRAHRQRLEAVLRLQARGFSLESIAVLLRAYEAGGTLASVLGLPEPADGGEHGETGRDDSAELYGFGDLIPGHGSPRPLLSLVPTTVFDHSQAS